MLMLPRHPAAEQARQQASEFHVLAAAYTAGEVPLAALAACG